MPDLHDAPRFLRTMARNQGGLTLAQRNQLVAIAEKIDRVLEAFALLAPRTDEETP